MKHVTLHTSFRLGIHLLLQCFVTYRCMSLHSLVYLVLFYAWISVIRVSQLIIFVSRSVLLIRSTRNIALVATDWLVFVLVMDALHVRLSLYILLFTCTTINYLIFSATTLLLRTRKLLLFLKVHFIQIFHQFARMNLSVRFLARMTLFATRYSISIPSTQ